MVINEGGNYQDMIAGIEAEKKSVVITDDADTKKEGWIHRHPFLATILGIVGLLFLGIALVANRIDVNPASSSGAWGGAGGAFFGTIKNAIPTGVNTSDVVVRLQSPDDAYAAVPIYKPTEQTDVPAGVDDIASLLAQLVQHTPVTPASTQEPATPDSYSFIPQGLVSTEPTTKKLSAEQERLKSYGNAVGTHIKGYEDTHAGSAQILKDHVEDRTNPDKIRALKILGTDMQQLGNDLKDLAEVPADIAGMHRTYANAYFAAGANLILIADTSSDEQFVDAITKYNAVVEKLSVQFQLLVALFGTNEVSFSQSEPGSIFMFSPNLSLAQ
ncbi:hypothetical protein JNK62_01805 [bacterium]|nr:hypothetical protein [bacterium]